MLRDPPAPSDVALTATIEQSGAPTDAQPVGQRGAGGPGTDDPAEPGRIGRYLVLRRLGQGGMGIVYLAYDPDLNRQVAIKIVRQGMEWSTAGRARVLREAQAMARV